MTRTPILILHGVGLGLVDAACNMQGSLAERAKGAPLFGRFFSASTMGGIIATVVTSAALTAGLMGQVPLVVAASIYLAVGLFGVRWFDPERAARTIRGDETKQRSPLPRAAIVAVGVIVFASFVIDASLATWATVYALALVGIALAGVASGALTPIAFGHAGEILPERSDEVIARVNLFNYAAALIGAVIPGLVAEFASLNWAFLLPAVVAVASIPLMKVLHDRVIAKP